MPGNRMSALPIAQFCGRAGELSIGAGRAAAMGSAFHAHCEGRPNALGALTPDERDEVSRWHRPADVTLPGGVVLSYQDAIVERRVAITAHGLPCEPDDPEALTVGTPDMIWIASDGERRTVYVGDLKRSSWTSGADSLQLAAYAFAVGAAHDCDAYACGIWGATEGEWDWTPVQPFDCEATAEVWRRVVHAARNVGGSYATGPHCGGCFSRFRCPAHLLPDMGETALAPFVQPDGLTRDNIVPLIHLLKRAKDTVETVDKLLKAFEKAQSRPIMDPETGLEHREVIAKGRESLDAKALEAAHPGLLAGFTKTGAPYSMGFRWLKPAKG